jgi:hypothetical protein
MNVRVLGICASFLSAGLVLLACGGAGRRSGFTTETDPTAQNPDGGGGSGGFGGAQPGQAKECGLNNTGDPDKDYDGDGYVLKDDCNECNTSVNKGAQDIPGNGMDDDCDGKVDNEELECDGSLQKAASDPYDAAKAIGLCKKTDPDGLGWGVTEAKWVQPDGTSLGDRQGVGILSKLGVNIPQMGKSFLMLSSGTAREPGEPGYASPKRKGYQHGTPPGYPKESPACPGVTTGQAQDGVALELKIRVPSNSKSFSYQQNFFTTEYPMFICKTFNDFFVTMMTPQPASLEDGNIAFDQDSNPISVNNSFLQVCSPGVYGGRDFKCPLGASTLSGTGFESHAATGWLTTSTPVEPKTEITLRFAIWDSGDGSYDSSVLIDDFKFSVEGADTAATKPSDPK